MTADYDDTHCVQHNAYATNNKNILELEFTSPLISSTKDVRLWHNAIRRELPYPMLPLQNVV